MSDHSIEIAITKLVQEAPARDRKTVDGLIAELRAVGSPLSLVIARTVEYVDDDLVDPGIALPALAEACATLEPMPDRPPKIATPDVSITQLKRR